MNVLVCNAGSTSLKFKLYGMPAETVAAECRIERIGDPGGGLFRYENLKNGRTVAEDHKVIADYEAGINTFLALLTDPESGVITDISGIGAVGYKTVLSKGHYGVHVIDDAVLKGMEDYMVVAPAHNTFYLQAIRTFQKIMPKTPMVGVFETAFHQTMPKEAYIYSTPYEWYEKYGLRRYGYHGASHSYVADCLTGRLGEKYRAVSCHLGGSGSLTAIEDGQSVDTSFGFSLQAGLPQMSRAGDIDPYFIFYLMKAEGMSMEEVEQGLRKKGGILGISGVSGDLRDVEEAAEKNERAQLAIDIYCREIVRYIGGYTAIMGGLDAIAFTGGIGENSKTVREKVLSHFAFLGLERSTDDAACGEISQLTTDTSPLRVFVIPANEELGIARKVAALAL
jgi:acetate kinase